MYHSDSEKTENSRDSTTVKSISSPLHSLKTVYEKLKQSYPDTLDLIQKSELFIPTSIFSQTLSSLESISKYLIENCKLSKKHAAQLLGRSNKNIWYAYAQSKKKHPQPFEVKSTSHALPTSIFLYADYSVLQNIVVYLRDKQDLTFTQIAKTLKRDHRTIWTTYHAALKKAGKRTYLDIKKHHDLTSLFTKFYNACFEYTPTKLTSYLEQEEAYVPLDTFSRKLGSLQTIVKYLVENYHLSLAEVAELLGRSNKNIWAAYNQAKKKQPLLFRSTSHKVLPVSILRSTKLSVLESIVVYLKNNGMSFAEIGNFLSRDEKTICTVFHNARKKVTQQKDEQS